MILLNSISEFRASKTWTSILCLIVGLLWSETANAQTYSLYVGETTTLYAPNPPMGTFDAASWKCDNSNVVFPTGNDGYRGSSTYVKVTGFFEGTATIECYCAYSYRSPYTNKMVVDHFTKYYYVTAKVTTLTLDKTEITLEPGEQIELKCGISPSGVEPDLKWTTSDSNVADFEGGWHSEIIGEKKVIVTAYEEGTCTITCDGNTGCKTPTCIIHVEDNRPHISASIESGSVMFGTKVLLTCDMNNADIYYTTNSADPTKASTRYTGPIEITQNITLKAIAFVGDLKSDILKKDYKVILHEDGEIFTFTTIDDVELTVKAYKDWDNIYLQIGSGEESAPAIDKKYTGHITIPEMIDGMRVARIGRYAFDKCELSSITLNSNTRISSYSFRGCDNMVEIDIPKTYVESWAFADCKSLRTVTLDSPSSFQEYFNYATNVFSGCDNIKKVYVNQSLGNRDIDNNISSSVFPSIVYYNATLYVPQRYLSIFKSTSGWEKFTNIESLEKALDSQVLLSSSISGFYGLEAGTKVYLKSPNVPDADIYYTLDGTTPSLSSTKYTLNGIVISKACILKAIAYSGGYDNSNVLIAGIFKIRPPLASPMKGSIKQVVAGDYHSLILKADGTLWTCGYNTHGQLGDGTTTNYTIPKKIMEDVTFVSSGGSLSFLLKTDGTLWACGYNRYGQLGNGTNTNLVIPMKIMDDIISVSSSGSHSLILKADGTLWACGYNNKGQLGDGTTIDHETPKQIMHDVAFVSAHGNCSFVIKTDGTLWGCGVNDFGQLGDGTTTDHKTFEKVMDNVSSVSTSGNHSLIIKNDGTLWACGRNQYGQLGNGSTTDCKYPVKIMDDVASVTTGQYHSHIIKTDGTLWASGRNQEGQLGDNSTIDRMLPVKVMDDVASVSAGLYHSLVIKADGTPWACGINNYGQLGDGTGYNSVMPIRIAEDRQSENVIVSIPPSGYATFYSSEYAYTLPTDLTAQTLTTVSGAKLTYSTLSGNTIPAGTAVMLVTNSKQAGKYTLTPTESDATYIGTNLLRGSDEATMTTGDGLHYKLTYGPTSDSSLKDVFGWYWGAQNGGAFQIEGHKAWLVVPHTATDTRAAYFSIDGDALGIGDVIFKDNLDNNCYDLQGRRVSQPTKKGIYIRNDHKIVNR